MKMIRNKLIITAILPACLFSCLGAQNPGTGVQQPDGLWKDVSELTVLKTGPQEPVLPEKFRLLELDVEQLKTILNRAPLAGAGAEKNSPVLLNIPFPDGRFREYRIVNDPVMHPDLARKFPEINAYSGQSVDDPAATIFFAFSPIGFHAILLSAGHSPVMIEPVAPGDTEHYLNYYQEDFAWDKFTLECSGGQDFGLKKIVPGSKSLAGDCRLRTYRLAIATTAEFTANFVNPPTDPTGVTGALASINAMLAIVNGVYRTELAIQMQLVANNNLLIFTNAMTDGYTNGTGNQNTMAGENQAIVDGAIGSGNYDIARAFGTTGTANSASGVSLQIGNVCVNANKANGATVMNPANPALAAFATLEMHEMGHQFGANHTFNEGAAPICSNAGQLVPATAYEPGSGSTIMSYDGTCGPANVQGFRDRYFHTSSLVEIGNYVTAGNGSTCPTAVMTANNQPTVSAGGVATWNIPISTPFMLTATANDPDGDPLTFCWEQFDNQLITHPPAATAASGPVFRSFLPVASPTRFFPNLNAILNGTTPTWEVLPSVSRTMNFVVTVRDNRAGGGCTDEDNVRVDVFNSSGPFVVNTPAAGACFAAGGTMNVGWNVAGTDAGDVDCNNVDILLSVDGGQTFPFILATATPNDGTQDVVLPDVFTKQARIMVRCSNNIFFNISPGDFTIDCVTVLIVTDNPASGTYKAGQRLETSGTVTVSGTAQFFAGAEVLLKPDFTALLGSDFLARIQPCVPCTGPKPDIQAMVETQNPKVYFANKPVRTTGRAEQAGIREPFQVAVYPNPFHQSFTVAFEIPRQEMVNLDLIDVTGRQVISVYRNVYLEAGLHQAPVPTQQLETGIYWVRINAGDWQQQVKLVKLYRN